MTSKTTASALTLSPTYPLYGPSYTLYRVSPLYNGTTPILASLAIHARRFRDIIKGDVLRGIQITHELQQQEHQSSTTSVRDRGAFKSCTWDLLGDEAAWTRTRAERDVEDDDEMMDTLAHVGVSAARGVRIEVVYERATYVGILIAPSSLSSSFSPVSRGATASVTGVGKSAGATVVANGFTHLPVLLVKMPVPLREALVGYLSTAFDARISPMKLRSGVMVSVLETVLDSTLSPFERDLREVNAFPKGLNLQLAFPSTTPGLRTLDIHIEQADLLPLLKQGRQLVQSHPQSRTSTTSRRFTGPFIAVLEAYLSQHLALSLAHPAVTIHRISLGPYSLSAEGKVKVITPSEATPAIWQIIFEAAATATATVPTASDASTDADIEKRLLGSKQELMQRAKRRAERVDGLRWDNDAGPRVMSAAKERVPSDPPPPYEMHDPALRDELMDDV